MEMIKKISIILAFLLYKFGTGYAVYFYFWCIEWAGGFNPPLAYTVTILGFPFIFIAVFAFMFDWRLFEHSTTSIVSRTKDRQNAPPRPAPN